MTRQQPSVKVSSRGRLNGRWYIRSAADVETVKKCSQNSVLLIKVKLVNTMTDKKKNSNNNKLTTVLKSCLAYPKLDHGQLKN